MSLSMPQVNSPATDLDITEWLGGPSTNISNELGRPILIIVFQVNCPGCFIYGIPETIEVIEKIKSSPLLVWGLATAFEDYDLNNFENLKKLINSGEVVGQTHETLYSKGMLTNNHLEYSIPFPVACDKIMPYHSADYLLDANNYIKKDFPQFESFPKKNQKLILSQVINHLKNKKFRAKTFEAYKLQGTPSILLIDKNGILRAKWFGSGYGLLQEVEKLLTL
tara:strand:- start:265 stop:933 length:669 start_codon:yes stop_codon:yes gene_type:complete